MQQEQKCRPTITNLRRNLASWRSCRGRSPTCARSCSGRIEKATSKNSEAPCQVSTGFRPIRDLLPDRYRAVIGPLRNAPTIGAEQPGATLLLSLPQRSPHRYRVVALTARGSRAPKNVNPTAARCGLSREGSPTGTGTGKCLPPRGPSGKTGRRRVRREAHPVSPGLRGGRHRRIAFRRYTHHHDASAHRYADVMCDILTNEPWPSVVCEWHN